MAQITPNSKVWLCNDVPLDPNYDNQMTFTTGSGTSRQWDITAQINYFMSKAVYSTTKFTPVKERGGVLRMTGMTENQFSMYNINYMVFTNTNFDGKYFYAFITKIQYINPGTTFIYFILDEIQTWMPDLEFMESNIEREHVEDDTIFKNIEDEGIAVQDRLGYGNITDFYRDIGSKIIVLGTTKHTEEILTRTDRAYYNPLKDYPNYTYLYDGITYTNIVSRIDETSQITLTGEYNYVEKYFTVGYNFNYLSFDLNNPFGLPSVHVIGRRRPGTQEWDYSAS